MKHIWTIAAKELRAYFNSTVALIFLAVFLGLVLFGFFWVDKFFARNIADVRPLFHWLPILLVFLVAALTMRLWSEEQRAGTLEILLTLPIPVHRLVLGKFFAGMGLVAVALPGQDEDSLFPGCVDAVITLEEGPERLEIAQPVLADARQRRVDRGRDRRRRRGPAGALRSAANHGAGPRVLGALNLRLQ